MVYFLVLYALFGTLVTLVRIRQAADRSQFPSARREADFRFGLVRIRENAESIAFYRGEAQESLQVRRRFTEAFNNFNDSSAARCS